MDRNSFVFADFDFLRHEKLDDRLYRIFEDFGGPQKINVYVVIGDEKTAVIDTGCGATGGLRKYIETYITDRNPIIALITHSHPDHIGGCTLFDAQYICEDELPQLAWGLDDKRRAHDAGAFAYTGKPGSAAHADPDRANAIWDYCREHVVHVDWRAVDWNIVRDGDMIDLGGIKLECIYLNCHGSMNYYCREQDWCLCGDNFTYTLALGDIDNDVVDKYRRFLKNFTDRTMFYSGHTYYDDGITRPKEIDMQLFRETVDAMQIIAEGGYFPEDEPELFIPAPEGVPTLMGYMPEEDAGEDVWEALRNGHPERKGKIPKEGTPYLHRVGPILLSYKR